MLEMHAALLVSLETNKRKYIQFAFLNAFQAKTIYMKIALPRAEDDVKKRKRKVESTFFSSHWR